MKKTFVFCGLLCCVLFLSACGKQDPIAPLSGTVTLQGQAIADCNVSFQPVAGKEMVAASGKTDAQGRFTLETIESPRRSGAAIGDYNVKFFWVDPDFNETKPKSPPYKIPSKYQQEGITFTVPPGGKTDVVFDLQP